MQNRKLKNSELNRKTAEEAIAAKRTPLILILDNVRSLNNIGAIFRTADAFLIEKIYLCGITATPPHKDIQKTALGATASVPWEYIEDASSLVESLKKEGVTLWAIEQAEGAVMLNDFQPIDQGKTAFILGNEVKGVQQALINLAGKVIEIPQEGAKHSLNISVSAGVICWDFYQKLKAKQSQ